MSFKDIFYQALMLPICSKEQIHLCNLVEGIMRNNSVKLFLIWTSGLGGDVLSKHFLSRALAAQMFSGAESFVQFW